MSTTRQRVDRSGLFAARRLEGLDPQSHPPVEEYLLEAAWSPWVIESVDPSLDLAMWIVSRRTYLDECLMRHGAILFRGFSDGEDAFGRFVSEAIPGLMSYREGATPRTAVGAGIYTSTEFPHGETIHLHNELSYVTDWPMRLAFACQREPGSGGATPLANVQRVLERLPSEIKDAFFERGWRLVRRYGDGLGPTWRRAFCVDTLEEVAEYCAAADLDLEIVDEEHVVTRQTRPAIRRHPLTGQDVWFNHVAFWHPSSLSQTLMAGLGPDVHELPFDTQWGDGEPIADDIVQTIRDTIEAETVRFDWRRGDILLLDNMFVAHGRDPFVGDRRILAAMGMPFSSLFSHNV